MNGCCEVCDYLLMGCPLRDLRFTDNDDCLSRRFSGNHLGSVGDHHVSDFRAVIFGSASSNPTGNALLGRRYPLTYPFHLDDQITYSAGAAGGALAIMEFIPEKCKHTISGPSLQVGVHIGAIAETILSFGITFAVLLIIIRGLRRLLAKTFLLALATISFVVGGSKYTGPAMNPAIAERRDKAIFLLHKPSPKVEEKY